ncbi:MAG TPA: hypothetical protein VJ672_17365 [Gemmatimonadaceae bacterium]|nr:hypothetical protein [Gemmatimonadaceae bacterium]
MAKRNGCYFRTVADISCVTKYRDDCYSACLATRSELLGGHRDSRFEIGDSHEIRPGTPNEFRFRRRISNLQSRISMKKRRAPESSASFTTVH